MKEMQMRLLAAVCFRTLCRSFLPGLLLVFIVSLTALAAETPDQEIELSIGGVEPISDVNLNAMGEGGGENGALGIGGGLGYFHDIYSADVALGASLDYLARFSGDSSTLIPNAVSAVSGDTFLLLAALKFHLDTEVISVGTPYISVGLGAGDNSTLVKAQPVPYSTGWINTSNYETREVIDDSQWVPAAAVKAGMDFPIGRSNSIGVEIGWTWLGSADYAATAEGRDAGIGCPTAGFASLGGLNCSGSMGHQYNIQYASGPLNLLTAAVHWGYRF